jgi:CYTH domain-containing protein
MEHEIERKFLLRGLPPRAREAPSFEIDQGYLPGDRINERIRRAQGAGGTRYYRTLKSGSGLKRTEVEEETTELFFSTVWPLTRGARVRKRRYVVATPDGEWEIDEFLDRDPLYLAEIELDYEDQVVEPPDWLAPVIEREVTDDRRYTNHALAK